MRQFNIPLQFQQPPDDNMVRLKDFMPKTVILLIGTKSGMSKTIQSRASSARTAPVAAPKKVITPQIKFCPRWIQRGNFLDTSFQGTAFRFIRSNDGASDGSGCRKIITLFCGSFMPCVIDGRACSMCSCYRFYGRRHDSTETTRDMIARERARTTHDTTKKGENTVFSISF